MSDDKQLKEMADAVKARAAERAPKEEPPTPEVLGEYKVLELQRENFLGDAKLFRHLHRGKVLYVHQQEKWMRWDGHHWQPDLNASHTLGLVEEVAQEYLRVAYIFGKESKKAEEEGAAKEDVASMGKKRDDLFARAKRCRGRERKTVLDFALSEPVAMSISGDEMDANPWLLGVKNGVLDLMNCELRPGRPEDYITRASPSEWLGPDADQEPFRNFLRDILSDDEESVSFMLRFLGMALIGRQREHKFLVLFGPGGRNGKDTLMSILTDVLGEQLCSSVPMEMFMEQPFMKDYSKGNPVDMGLRGKRLVYASESSKRHKFSGETMKNLTGGGRMEARGLHENHMTSWERSHTIVLLTNELPAAAATDDAFWERLLGVELKRRFVDDPDQKNPNERCKDPDLRERMRTSAPGIMAALMEGFRDYMQGGLRPPEKVQSFKEAYRKSEDLIGNFLEECCEVDLENLEDQLNRTQSSHLYECFTWWYEHNVSRRTPSPKFFKESMLKKGMTLRKNNNMYWLGVRISYDTIESMRNDKEDS